MFSETVTCCETVLATLQQCIGCLFKKSHRSYVQSVHQSCWTVFYFLCRINFLQLCGVTPEKRPKVLAPAPVITPPRFNSHSLQHMEPDSLIVEVSLHTVAHLSSVCLHFCWYCLFMCQKSIWWVRQKLLGIPALNEVISLVSLRYVSSGNNYSQFVLFSSWLSTASILCNFSNNFGFYISLNIASRIFVVSVFKFIC